MKKWDTLPIEILQRILKLLEPSEALHCKGGEWPVVTKQWYKVYQSIIYKSAKVDLSLTFNSGTRTRKIMNSVYRPGQWVKMVMLGCLGRDISNLLGYEEGVKNCIKFMLRTPTVRYVKLLIDSVLWWKCLETVLASSSNTWKLLGIDTPDGSYDYPQSYFACASLVKKSLEYLSVTDDMLVGSQLSRLREFKNLTSLNVCHGIFQNIQQLYDLLKHLPRLKDVDAYVTNLTADDDVKKNNDTAAKDTRVITATKMNSIHYYSSIQSMTLRAYAPSPANDIETLMKSFPNIQQMYIHGIACTNITWPSAIGSQNLITLLKYLNTLKEYTLFMNLDDHSTLLKDYYNSRTDKDHTSILSFDLTSGNLPCSPAGDESSNSLIGIRKNKANETELGFYLGMVDDGKEEDQGAKIMDILSRGNELVKGIQINTHDVTTEREISIYLKKLLMKNSFGNDLKLTFENGCLHDSSLLLSTPHHHRLSAQIMEFTLSEIWETALVTLSKRLPSLDTLKFNNCGFKGSDISPSSAYIKIHMTDTDIGRLVITDVEEDSLTSNYNYMFDTDILIAIKTKNPPQTKYYASMNFDRDENDESTTHEIPESAFQKFVVPNYVPEETSVICIHVKSLKRLTVQMEDWTHPLVDIELS